MRFFLSIFGVIVFIVVVIVIIANNSNSSTSPKPIVLTNYNNANSSVTQISTGTLVGEENRQAVRITISQASRTIYFLTGYEQTILNSETLPNNPQSYSVFLGALSNAGFTSPRKTSEVNMFGVCPLGSTYQYQLNNNNNSVSNLWSTSCQISDGTFNGDGPLIRQIFELQIPDFSNFTQTATTISF